MPGENARPRTSLLMGVYALVLTSEVVYAAIVPLTPFFRAELGLSELQVGALLAASSVASVAVSLPAGMMSDRIGADRATAAAGALLAGSAVWQGLAREFWSLLAARAVFGVAFAVIWTAGLAWISEALPPARRASALGFATTVAGVGIMAGPVFAAVLTEAVSVRLPFLLLGALAGAATGLLVRNRARLETAVEPRSLATSLGAAISQAPIRAALGIMLLGGLAASTVNVLVPLELSGNGVSTSAIGAAFSAGSLVFIAVSSLVARLGARLITVTTAGVLALLLGGAFALPVISLTTFALVAFLLLRAPVSSTLFTIAYPLADDRAARSNRGVVLGVLNVGWGFSTMVGPLAVGAIAGAGGARPAFAAMVAAATGTGLWLLWSDRDRALARPPGSEQPRHRPSIAPWPRSTSPPEGARLVATDDRAQGDSTRAISTIRQDDPE